MTRIKINANPLIILIGNLGGVVCGRMDYCGFYSCAHESAKHAGKGGIGRNCILWDRISCIQNQFDIIIISILSRIFSMLWNLS